MRNWVFDIQRFALVTIDSLKITGLANDGNTTYWSKTGTKLTDTSSLNATDVVAVTVTTAGGYSFALVDFTTGTPNPATNALGIKNLIIESGASAGSAASSTIAKGSSTTGGTVQLDNTSGLLTIKSASGGSVSDGNSTFKATTGKTATVTFDATATLDDGSVELSGVTVIKPNATGNTGEVVGATAGTTITVTAKGEVSGLDANDTFYIGVSGAAAGDDDIKYEVAADALSIKVTAPDATGTAATYLLTSKLSNTTITSTDGHAAGTVDTISNGVKATELTFTVDNASGTAKHLLGTGNASVKTYVYKKNGEILQAGYSDSSIGTPLGVLSYDGSQYYMYDASTSSTGQHLDNSGANVVTTVKGGSGNDTLATTATNTAWTNQVAVTVDGGAGNDFVHVTPHSATSIAGGAGNDTIQVGDTTATAAVADVVLSGGEGNDLIKSSANIAAQNTSTWSVLGGAGNDTIDFSNVDATKTHTEWLVDAGDGNNSIKVGTGITYSTVKAGSGKDTIVSNSATNTVTGGAGADVFDISTAGNAANIADYTYGTDFIRVDNSATTKDDFLTDINMVAQTKTNMTSEGKLNYARGNTGAATITSSAGFYAVNLVDNTDAKNKASLAWVKDNATTVNGGSLTENLVMVGNTNTEGDLIVGGSKADTIYAGASDSVYGGAGADAISLEGSSYGVYVGVATDSGADTVANFNVGFDIDSADAVYLVNGTAEDVDINNDGTNVTVKDGKGSLQLTGKGSTGTDGVKLLFGNKKVYSIAEGTQLAVSSAEDFADYYYGTKNTANGSGINLANYADDISVDLSNAMFNDIASVTGGSANTTIMGSKAAETLFGGTGATSLYGGAGKDSLVSGTGVTTFFLTNGVGKDSNEETSDVVDIFNAPLTGITRSATNTFTVKVSDTDSLQIAQATDGVDQKIQWVSGAAKGVAKIGMSSQANNFSYEEGVTNYLGGSKNDTISFGSGSEDINLWLDQISAVSSIETFDASSRSGSVLIAGSSAAAETLRGGSGDSSLWGGTGNQKDVLVGNTSGTTNFFYGKGQGSDSISGGSNDTVNLYDMQLSDLASANVDTSNRRVIFTTTAGDTVTVSGGVQNFSVGGTTYQTSYASSTDWTAKA